MADKLVIDIDGDLSDFESKVKSSAGKTESEFSKAIATVGKGASAVGTEIGSELQKVWSVGSGAFKAITGTISIATTAVGGLLTKGQNYNMLIENGVKSLEVLLGSSDKAEKMLNELKEYDKISPFDLSQLLGSAKEMMSYGIEAEKVLPVMKQLGDIAMGDQNKLSGLAYAFAQISAAGKLNGQDLNQMINNGFNPLQFIAQRTGESMAELKDRMSEGAISAEEVAQAFADATAEGGRFYKATEKLSETASGRMSILQADFESFLGQLASGWTEVMGNQIVPSLADYLGQMQEAFESGGFGKLAESFGAILADMLNRVVEAIPNFLDVGIKLVNNLIGGIQQNLPSLLDSGLLILNKLIEGIWSVVDSLMPVASDIIGAIAQGFIEYAGMIMELGMVVITTIAQGLAENVETLAPSVVNMITYIITAISEYMPMLIESAVAILQGIGTAIFENRETLITAISSLIGEIGFVIGNNFSEILVGLGEIIIPLVEALLASVATLIIGLLAGLLEDLNEWTQNVANWLTENEATIMVWWETLKQKTIEMIDNIKQTVSDWLDQAKNDISTFCENVKTAVTDFLSGVKESITSKIDEVKQTVSNWLSNMKEALRSGAENAVQSFKNVWNNLPSQMAEIGSNIVSGIWNGISGAAGWLRDQVVGFAQSISGWVKDTLGINSPSKVFAEIGGYMTEGMEIGMESKTADLKATANNQMKALQSIYGNGFGLNPSMAGIGDFRSSVSNITNENGSIFNFTNYFGNGDIQQNADDLASALQFRLRAMGY